MDFHNANLPQEDESDDTAALDRAGLLEKIGVLEPKLVGGVEHGFDNVIAQLKVVNPGVELCVEGIGFLKWVADGVIVAPPAEMEVDGHVVDAPTE